MIDHDAAPGRLDRCQITGSSNLNLVIDLGHQPPCDSLLTAEMLHQPEKTYPLRLMHCPESGLAQLDYVIDGSEIYYPEYPYRSGISKPLEDYQRAFADRIVENNGRASEVSGESEKAGLRLLNQVGRFVLVGAINVVITYSLFLILSSFLHHAIAYTITYVVGVAFAYAMAVTFVFGTGFNSRSAFRFPFVYVFQYLYGLAALTLLIDGFGLGRQAAICIVIATSLPFTFILSRRAVAARDQDSPG